MEKLNQPYPKTQNHKSSIMMAFEQDTQSTISKNHHPNLPTQQHRSLQRSLQRPSLPESHWLRQSSLLQTVVEIFQEQSQLDPLNWDLLSALLDLIELTMYDYNSLEIFKRFNIINDLTSILMRESNQDKKVFE